MKVVLVEHILRKKWHASLRKARRSTQPAMPRTPKRLRILSRQFEHECESQIDFNHNNRLNRKQHLDSTSSNNVTNNIGLKNALVVSLETEIVTLVEISSALEMSMLAMSTTIKTTLTSSAIELQMT